eukprot:gene8927-6410_t
MRANPKVQGLIAIGCNAGTTILFHAADKSTKLLSNPDKKLQVEDLQWDRLSTSYLLVAYRSHIELWDTESTALVHSFDKQPIAIQGIAWMDWTAGNFISFNNKNNNLKVWNASQKHPIETMKIRGGGDGGLTAISFNPAKKHAIMACVDGSIVVTGDGNAIVMEIDVDYIKDPSNNPALLGSRRRGTQRDVTSDHYSQPVNRRTIAHPGIVYGVAWAPFQSTIFATCCHDGLVRVFNYAMMGELLYTLRGHNARVFSVNWSPIVPGLLATASDDRSILVWNINESSHTGGSSSAVTPKMQLQGHTNNVRALCWSCELDNILLSGSWDSTIRVWNVNTGHCLAIIRDHNADIYSIASHPQMPFTYISCSRDNTVRLWELGGLVKVMRYYAIWDGNFGRILSRTGEPGGQSDAEASIYSFLRASLGFSAAGGESKASESKTGGGDWASADLRFRMRATLVGKESNKLHKSLTGGETELKDLIGHHHDDPSRASRRGGSRLERNLPTDPLRMAHIYYKLFAYFNGSGGVMDLWENTITILENQKTIRSSFFQAITSSSAWLRPTALRQVLHESEVLGQSQLEARKLASQTKVSMKKSDNSAEENQLSAALAFMRMGEFAKYCAIMVELGKWEAALAVAPSVSLDYWRYLSFQYAMSLKEQSSEMAIPHLLCIGKDADAVDYYLNRVDPHSAMTIAKMSEQRTDVIPDLATGPDGAAGFANDITLSLPKGRYTHGSHTATNNNNNGSSGTASGVSSPVRGGLTRQSHHSSSLTTLDAINIVVSDQSPINNHATRERTERETEESRNLVRSVAQQASRRMLKVAQPLLAAAHLLSVENIRGCIELLMINHEPDLAYALAKCFKLDTTKIAMLWADQCAALGALDLALEILDDLKYTQQHQQMQSQSQRAAAVAAQAQTPQKPPMNPTASSAAAANAAANGPTHDAEEEISLLLSKFSPNERFTDEIVQQRQLLRRDLMDRRTILEKAKEDEAIGQDGDAITEYVMARSYTSAVQLGIRALKRMLNDALNLTANGKRILHALQHVRARDIEDSGLRMMFLCHMLWFSAHRAARKGAFHTAHTMLNILLDFAPKTDPAFPISAASIQYQMIFFMIYAGDTSCQSLLSTILSTELPSGQVREGLRALNLLLKEEKGWTHWMQRLSVKWNRVSTANGYHPALSSMGSTTFNSTMASPRLMTKMPSASGFESVATPSSMSNGAGDVLLSPTAKGGKLVHTNSFGESMMTSAMMNTMGGVQSDVTLNLIVSVIGEIHKLTDALQLPSLTRLNRSNSRSSNATNAIDYVLDLLLAPQPVIQGSLLPVSNQQLKTHQSSRRIQGREYELQDHVSYMSVNEAADWLRFHGFSPLMTGDFMMPLA